MGARKRLRAEKLKAAKRTTAIASLRDCPTSPRKMRLLADMIRGVEINKALGMLRYSKKEASVRLEKLLRSAIANWEAKNQGLALEETPLCVKTIFVDGGRQLKRIQPAPQGRAHRIRKRSNHVTIIVDRIETAAGMADGTIAAPAAPAAEAKTAEPAKTAATGKAKAAGSAKNTQAAATPKKKAAPAKKKTATEVKPENAAN
ncbi:MAG: 50S ribosomal protein L22 [Rikenella sp.]|nr:50S ribosomal protein L22 [Rikenella sp.]